MDKKYALQLLITHSFLLTDFDKNQLILKIPEISEEQIDFLGKLLAEEKKQSLMSNYNKIQSLDKVLEKLGKLAS